MKNDTISRKLVQRELPPRKSRHGKEQVRESNMLRVANGPTQKKGLMNGGVDAGVVPGWWKEEK